MTFIVSSRQQRPDGEKPKAKCERECCDPTVVLSNHVPGRCVHSENKTHSRVAAGQMPRDACMCVCVRWTMNSWPAPTREPPVTLTSSTVSRCALPRRTRIYSRALICAD